MEPYSYVGNNPIMFTDPTGMSKEGGEGTDNRYRGVWNHCENRYDYELINNVGGNEVDTVHYEGGIMDGKSLDYMVETERTYFNDFREKYHTKEIERKPGYRHLLKNTFNGHAIDQVTISGALSDLVFDFISETSGSPVVAFAFAAFSGNPKKALGMLASGSKGEKLAQKLIKFGDNGSIPIPDINKDQFKRAGGELVHKETGAIYRKSKTTHRGKDGEFKIWPAGTKDFGKTSKTTGNRITTDSKGNIIGH